MVTTVPVTQQQKTVTASPGDSVVILVRAKQGNSYSDWASLPYTVPSTSQSGANLTTTNSSTDIKLNGGSLYAGSFPGTTVGTFNVVSGSTTGTGIILNSTGMAGFAGGTKKFYIDASTGNAYFGGTLTAASGTFTGTLSGVSGTFSGTISASNIYGSTISGSILSTNPVTSSGVTTNNYVYIHNGSTAGQVDFYNNGSAITSMYGLSSQFFINGPSGSNITLSTITSLSNSSNTITLGANSGYNSNSYIGIKLTYSTPSSFKGYDSTYGTVPAGGLRNIIVARFCSTATRF